KYESREISSLLFQATLIAMGVATFSFMFASFHYYACSRGSRIDEAERALHARRADRFWLLGYALLVLEPSLTLFLVGLSVVGAAWFVLWLAYLGFAIRLFPRVEAGPQRADAELRRD